MTVELVIQSIIVYTLFGWGMYRVAQFGVKNKYGLLVHKTVPIESILFCTLLFALISGLRWGVGVDYYGYLNGYEFLQNNGYLEKEHLGEPLWDWILKLFASQGLHYSLWFGFWASIQALFVCLTFKDKPKVFPYAALLCILGDYYLTMMNGIRQSVACCIFIYAVQFIPKKKIIPYAILVLIASSIHKSALITAPLFLFFFDKTEWTKRPILYIIVGICTVLGYTSFVTSMLDNAVVMLDLLNYDTYVDRFESFSDESRFSNAAWGPIRLSKYLVGVFVIYFYPQISEYFKNDYVKIAFKLFFIGFCVSNLAANTYYLFIRPFWYITFLGLPMTAFVLAYLYEQGKKQRKLYLLFMAVAVLPLYWAVIKGYRSADYSYSIYQFFFSSDKIYLRPF